MRWVACAVVLCLFLAGCSKPEANVANVADDGNGDSTFESGVGEPEIPTPNMRPLPQFDATVVNGSMPLNVTFTLDGADPDGDRLNWSVDIESDGVSEFNGTALPASVNFTFTAAGTFNVTYTLSDGLLEAQSRITINVTGEVAVGYGPVQAPVSFSGTTAGANGAGPVGRITHTLDVQPGQRLIHATITYGTACAGDIDWYLYDPAGAEKDSSESLGNSEGPLDYADPAPGAWSIQVMAYAAVCQTYNVLVSFE